jgi:hypothetical protein
MYNKHHTYILLKFKLCTVRGDIMRLFWKGAVVSSHHSPPNQTASTMSKLETTDLDLLWYRRYSPYVTCYVPVYITVVLVLCVHAMSGYSRPVPCLLTGEARHAWAQGTVAERSSAGLQLPVCYYRHEWVCLVYFLDKSS